MPKNRRWHTVDCKHEWQGVADSVVCIHCGLRLTREEYLEKLKPEKPKEAPKKTKKKDDKGAK